MKETMQAAVINAPGDYGVREVPVPACPPGGMLVKVVACGLCGSDLRTLRSGHHRVKLPYIVGHEVSAEVVAVGEGYDGPWAVGERLAVSPLVYCGECKYCRTGRPELCLNYRELAQAWPGGFAEYMAIPREAVVRGTLQRIPEGLDPISATLAEPLSSCVNAQEKGGVNADDVVLIMGAGPVGTLHMELSRARGAARIIVTDISEERLQRIKALGPDHLANSAREDLTEKVTEWTDGYGPDVIITANPDPAAQVQAVELAAKGGRILLFGGLPAGHSHPAIDMNRVHYKALHLIGTTIFAPRHNRTAMQLLAGGKIRAEKIISHVLPLERFVEGAALALEGKTGKVVFKP
jgi:L-iditol 2-dehydrogenase